MGNSIDPRSQFDGGYLYVKTDRPYYYPGNVVMGKIYIRTSTQLDAKDMKIKVKGKEQGSFWEGGGDNRHKNEFKRQLINFEATCMKFEEVLGIGDYTIPFEFQIPATAPASLIIENTGHGDDPKAKIKYSIQVTLSTKSDKIMKYKQWLIIYE